MRESVGSTFVFTLAITFTLIFAGFLTLAINYNRAYKIKNEITSMIERYEGLTGSDANNAETSTTGKNSTIGNGGSINIINNYLKQNNYSAMGTCDAGDYGIKDLDANYENARIESTATNGIIVTNENEKYYYCIHYEPDNNNCVGYFKVKVFFDFNLPIFGQLTKFNVTGQTNGIYPVYIGKTEIMNENTCK